MGRLNKHQWRSEDGSVNVERLRDNGLDIRVSNRVSYMGHQLSAGEARDFAQFVTVATRDQKIAAVIAAIFPGWTPNPLPLPHSDLAINAAAEKMAAQVVDALDALEASEPSTTEQKQE